jgi:NADP-dependent aldehyde dehydrogenase
VPSAVFSLVHTSSREVNLDLVRHPSVAAVGFTGSQHGARVLFDAAAARVNCANGHVHRSGAGPFFSSNHLTIESKK